MRAIYRAFLVTGLVVLGPALTACSNFDMDKLDVFGLNEKKKLPGERKDVFPGGVPGVTQGIPPEYMRGNQPSPETAQSLAPDQNKQAAAGDQDKNAAAEPEPKPKPKPKRVAKPKPASPPPAQAADQSSPWPQQAQPQTQQNAQSPWPAPAQANTASPWPSSPQPGTFSR
jgi:hypothetical protein